MNAGERLTYGSRELHVDDLQSRWGTRVRQRRTKSTMHDGNSDDAVNSHEEKDTSTNNLAG